MLLLVRVHFVFVTLSILHVLLAGCRLLLLFSFSFFFFVDGCVMYVCYSVFDLLSAVYRMCMRSVLEPTKSIH